MSRGLALGLGFSKLVSVGNEADLSVGRLGRLLLDDPDTQSFLLFLETIRDAEELAAFAAEAMQRGKPVLAYLLGRSGEGQELGGATHWRIARRWRERRGLFARRRHRMSGEHREFDRGRTAICRSSANAATRPSSRRRHDHGRWWRDVGRCAVGRGSRHRTRFGTHALGHCRNGPSCHRLDR